MRPAVGIGCQPRAASFPRGPVGPVEVHRRTSLVMGRAWFAVFVFVQETGG